MVEMSVNRALACKRKHQNFGEGGSMADLLGGRYTLESPLGQGGMSSVYKALDTKLNRVVALKVVQNAQADFRRALAREAKILAQLSHPRIAAIYDHFEDQTNSYIVMEYVKGATLSSTFKAKPQKQDEVVKWADQILDVLEYLHGQTPPVICRDLNPNNLLLCGGDLKLIDFGISKVLETGSVTSTVATGRGTPGYAPLEQYSSRQGATDQRSDFYALGATLYFLLTGRDPPEAVDRVQEGVVLKFPVGSTGSAELRTLVAELMDLDKNKRPTNVASIRSKTRTGPVKSVKPRPKPKPVKPVIDKLTSLGTTSPSPVFLPKSETIALVAAKSAEDAARVERIREKTGDVAREPYLGLNGHAGHCFACETRVMTANGHLNRQDSKRVAAVTDVKLEAKAQPQGCSTEGCSTGCSLLALGILLCISGVGLVPGLILLALYWMDRMDKKPEKKPERKEKTTPGPSPPPFSDAPRPKPTMKKCPSCSKEIQAGANRCKFCWADLHPKSDHRDIASFGPLKFLVGVGLSIMGLLASFFLLNLYLNGKEGRAYSPPAATPTATITPIVSRKSVPKPRKAKAKTKPAVSKTVGAAYSPGKAKVHRSPSTLHPH